MDGIQAGHPNEANADAANQWTHALLYAVLAPIAISMILPPFSPLASWLPYSPHGLRGDMLETEITWAA
jgi:hypothetical protein